MGALCVRCSNDDDSVEFATMRDLVEHEKGGHVSRPVVVLPPSPEKGLSATERTVVRAVSTPITEVAPSIQQPLKLQYKWNGVHAKCGTEIKTIEVDLDEWSLLIAYCAICDEKLETEIVIPIHRQTTAKSSGNSVETFETLLKGKKKS